MADAAAYFLRSGDAKPAYHKIVYHGCARRRAQQTGLGEPKGVSGGWECVCECSCAGVCENSRVLYPVGVHRARTCTARPTATSVSFFSDFASAWGHRRTRLPYHVIHTSRLRMKQLAKPSRGTCYASGARASKAACQNTTIFHGRV